MNCIKTGLLGFFVLIALNSYAGTNSFTCDAPQSSLEILICQDDELSRSNTTYNDIQILVSKISGQEANDIGRELYVELRKCGDEKNCLLDAYRQAINSLKVTIEKNRQNQKPSEMEKPVVTSYQVTTEKPNNMELNMFAKYTLNDYSLLLNAYLFLAGFLFLLTRIYSTKNFLTKTLFFIIGFPFVLIGWLVALVNIRSNSGRYLNENQSDNDYDSDDEPVKKGSSFRKSSSRSSSSIEQQKEKIIIEYQGTGGGWFTIGGAPNDDFQIAQALKHAAKGIAKNPNFSGKIRAKGADSGRVYDMNITK